MYKLLNEESPDHLAGAGFIVWATGRSREIPLYGSICSLLD